MATGKKNRRGRPPKGSENAKGAYLEVRLKEAEKEAFKAAADLAGQALSVWVRARLRAASIKELTEAGLPVAFHAQQQADGERQGAR